MNAAQFAKYHVLKKQWKESREKRGMSGDQAALDALQRKQIGRACSSKMFSQSDLDRMVAGFLAELSPADLNAQIHQIDQPHKRCALLEEKIFALSAQFLTSDNAAKLRWATISYVRPILKSLGASGDWPCGDEAVLKKLMGILEQRAKQVARQCAKAETAKTGNDEPPF